jgi:hypothetical protein
MLILSPSHEGHLEIVSFLARRGLGALAHQKHDSQITKYICLRFPWGEFLLA